jgi:dTMP kinase
VAPRQVLGSLRDAAADTAEAWELREQLSASFPVETAGSLEGLDSERAWELRERLYFAASESVVGSLAGLDGTKAWSMRLRWLSDSGGEGALALDRVARTACRSIRGLDSEVAWSWRQLAWASAPDAVLRSVEGLDVPRAWELRERHGGSAPKAVLATLTGLDTPRAWTLRRSFGAQCEEVLDSIFGMTGTQAWELRAVLADTWPAAAVRSLGPLLQTPRGRALTERILASHPRDFAHLRQAVRGAAETSQGTLHASA